MSNFMTLVVARTCREYDDYLRVLRDKDPTLNVQNYRYVFGFSCFAGRKPSQTQCILLGKYPDRRDWEYLRVHLHARGIQTTEVYDWR